ncbi:MAG: penicillin-binding protein activator LpoB [Kiritimatiellia bacterium]|nr:penicillin-binding protein activator LpoB [Kiritimatiellia bacterium]
MNRKWVGMAGAAAAAVMMTGCATTPAVREVALDRAPITSKLEPQDVRRTVEKMAESLLSAPGVREAVGGTRPVLDVEPLKNRTTQHVDMVSITDSLRMQLLRSGLFRFVDKSTSGTDIEFMDAQANLGLTDQKKAVRPGQQSAAQMYLTGALTEIKNQVGRTVDQYYKFSMVLKDLRSGELVWADEQEIRKESVKPRLGF